MQHYSLSRTLLDTTTLFITNPFLFLIVAVVVGFILAGVFLGIFVHPGADVKITTKNAESWIGAWWLGFAIFAGLAFVVGIFLLGIPARVKSKDKEV